MDKVLAAFTMSEMERLQGIPVANFKRGKDKKKRKKRGLGFAAGVGAAGAAGLAGIGAAARYGGAEISQRRRANNIAKDFIGEVPKNLSKADRSTLAEASKGLRKEAIELGYAGRGARQTLSKDLDRVGLKNAARKVSNTASRAFDSAKRAGGAVKRGFTTPTGTGGTNAGVIREAANRLGNAAKGAVSTKAGKIGVGLAGAAALGGAGALGYRALQGRKKNKGKK